MVTSEVDLKPESKIEQAEFAAPAESTSACQADDWAADAEGIPPVRAKERFEPA